MEQFRIIQSRILYDQTYTHFTSIIGGHALCLYELALADRTNQKKSCVKIWNRLSQLNGEWISLICHDDSDLEFTQLTRKLVELFTETMGDFVFDRSIPKNMSEIIKTESAFYKALSQNGKMQLTQEWTRYTQSILYMVKALDDYGKNSEGFYYGVSNCLQSGVLLGQCLNHALFKKPWTSFTTE
jgi:hypothetical protein